MRTTLTLDDDLADKLKALAERRRISFEEAVNEVLRRGISAQSREERPLKPFRITTFRSAFRPGVDPVKLNQLSDEIAVEHARPVRFSEPCSSMRPARPIRKVVVIRRCSLATTTSMEAGC